MFRFICGAAVALALASASAHEIKVLASRQTLPEGGGKTTVYLSWGHRLPVDELIDAAPVERCDLIAPDGTTAELKKEGVSLQTNAVAVKEAGVHTAVVVRKPSVFTYVLGDDGEREFKRGSKTDNVGAKIESASRTAQTGKALIVVGKPGDAAPKPVGLSVEIVPLDGPTKWVANADVRFQILIGGKPATGAEVFARSVGFKPDDAWSYATESGRKGEFTVRPSQAGTWIVKVSVKKLAQGKIRDEYDFETFTTTLSLEVLP